LSGKIESIFGFAFRLVADPAESATVSGSGVGEGQIFWGIRVYEKEFYSKD